jgi:hypothetical protein|uniref:Uncharacterized protein n=1 Tax=viral metagenome TaxID=1070528 RepID=A0A6C0LKV6_9ZZZZ
MKIIENNKDIHAKIIKYNKNDGLLNIYEYPIIAWKITEHEIDNEPCIPVFPAGVSLNDETIYYSWNNRTYDSNWERVTYEDILNMYQGKGKS